MDRIVLWIVEEMQDAGEEIVAGILCILINSIVPRIPKFVVDVVIPSIWSEGCSSSNLKIALAAMRSMKHLISSAVSIFDLRVEGDVHGRR